jgi:hypothetical protein
MNRKTHHNVEMQKPFQKPSAHKCSEMIKLPCEASFTTEKALNEHNCTRHNKHIWEEMRSMVHGGMRTVTYRCSVCDAIKME